MIDILGEMLLDSLLDAVLFGSSSGPSRERGWQDKIANIQHRLRQAEEAISQVAPEATVKVPGIFFPSWENARGVFLKELGNLRSEASSESGERDSICSLDKRVRNFLKKVSTKAGIGLPDEIKQRLDAIFSVLEEVIETLGKVPQDKEFGGWFSGKKLAHAHIPTEVAKLRAQGQQLQSDLLGVSTPEMFAVTGVLQQNVKKLLERVVGMRPLSDRMIESATGAISGAASAVAGTVSSAASTTVGAFSSATNATTNAISGATNAATGAVSSAASTTVGALSSATNATTNAISGAASATTDAVSSATSRMKDVTTSALGKIGFSGNP